MQTEAMYVLYPSRSNNIHGRIISGKEKKKPCVNIKVFKFLLVNDNFDKAILFHRAISVSPTY